ncbi:MAG TPA: gamma-glutamyltransferase [Candidatus Binatia bacterium]|nr:gamma-glutamyltransferase [Candidatus Binatia bacterium]
MATRFYVLVLLGLAVASSARPAAQTDTKRGTVLQTNSNQVVECHHGVVVSVSSPATEAGLSILKQGGDAVDAAVATAFALAVTYPPGGNIGGGGFMLVHPAPGRGAPVVFDYRECAPAAAYPGMYTSDESQFTHRAVAVPGTVRGLALAHRRFGTMAWSQLLQPAIILARNGFKLDSNLAKSLNETLAAAPEKAEFQRVFAKPGGGLWVAGDRLVQPDLAGTLQSLARLGPDEFYTGAIAEQIVAEMSKGGGLITAEDLAHYRAIERQPLSTRYRGKYDIYVPPPPSSGGVCLLEELNMLETFNFKTWRRWSPRTLHVMAEAMRRANYDRARYLGDPAFVKIPANLTTHEYGRQLAQTIALHKATRSDELSAGLPLSREGHNTTHFSIIDRDGMAVANTYTLERLWGSRVVVPKAGFLLNNQMRAFNLFPNAPDISEATSPYTVANTIAPGKRPLTSMSPTIVASNGRVKLITGSPGSQAIPHTILCILLNVVDFKMPIQMAVASPRFSHSWLPDEITFETPELHPESVQSLRAMGHTVVPPHPLPFQGDAHTIWVRKPNDYVGVADRRRSDQSSALGY